MVESEYMSPWIFVIDTNQYAGNFERTMCAYCTGMIGDCEVGIDLAQEFYDDFGFSSGDENVFEEYIDPHIMDYNGCGRPTSIWKDDNKSVAIFFHKQPTLELISIMKERAYKFVCSEEILTDLQCKDFKIIGFRLFQQSIVEREINLK